MTFGVHHPSSLQGYTPKVVAPILYSGTKPDADDLTGRHRSPDSPSSKGDKVPPSIVVDDRSKAGHISDKLDVNL